MQTPSLQTRRPRATYGTAPNAPSCHVDYRKHYRDQQRSLSYMEKLLGEG